MEFSSPTNVVDLVDFKPGKIMMRGERFLLLNTGAWGNLRRDLVSMLGKERAKGFLIRHGWSCGYKDAISVRNQYPNAPVSFLLEQGPILHTLEGVGEAIVNDMMADQKNGTFYREGYWLNSFEAEQHLYHFGLSQDPVCWMMIGYAGGYCSGIFGRQILYKEVKCVGRGDEHCQFVGKTVEEWGNECIHELPYYGESKIAEELEEANRRIHQQHQFLEKMVNFHEKLSQIVLNGQSRQVIIDEIGQMVGAPVVVEDANLYPLNWYLPMSEQSSDEDLRKYFLGSIKEEEHSLLARLRQVEREKRGVDLVFTDNPSILSRTIAPIIVGQEITGFLSVIHEGEEVNEELRKMIVERAALVMAFDALNEQTALETEHRLKGEFLDDLLADGAPAELLQKRARFMGLDLNKPLRFLLITANHSFAIKTKNDDDLLLSIRKKLFKFVQLVVNTYKKNAVIVERREGIIVLANTGNDRNEFDQLIRDFQNRREGLQDLSLSMCISRESRSTQQLSEVFNECKNILDVMKRLGRNDEIIFVEKIALFDMLYASPSQDQLKVYAERALEKLLEYDQNYGATRIVQTLFRYLSNDCNLQKTSRDLNVSISGLKYRIQRIREIGEIDLEDPEKRFNIQLALRILIANGRITFPKS